MKFKDNILCEDDGTPIKSKIKWETGIVYAPYIPLTREISIKFFSWSPNWNDIKNFFVSIKSIKTNLENKMKGIKHVG